MHRIWQKKTDTTVVKKEIPFDINLQLRSNYSWRGFTVSDAPITDVDMHYDFTRSKSLQVGVRGGTSFTGDYKEFDYYVSYSRPTGCKYVLTNAIYGGLFASGGARKKVLSGGNVLAPGMKCQIFVVLRQQVYPLNILTT